MSAAAVTHLSNSSLDARRVAHIHSHCAQIALLCTVMLHLLQQLLQLVLPPSSNHNPRAMAGQSLRKVSAKARRRSCHKADLPECEESQIAMFTRCFELLFSAAAD
jgi:hypothetical protein